MRALFSIPTLVLTVVLLGLASTPHAAPGPAREGEPETTDDECYKWALDGLRLGMTLGEVKALDPKAKKIKNLYFIDGLGKAWYRVRALDERSKWHEVLPESDSDDAPVIAIATRIEARQGSSMIDFSRELIAEFEERWGRPTAEEPMAFNLREGNVFSQNGFFWADSGCDVRALVLDVRTSTQNMNPNARPARVGDTPGTSNALIYQDYALVLIDRPE